MCRVPDQAKGDARCGPACWERAGRLCLPRVRRLRASSSAASSSARVVFCRVVFSVCARRLLLRRLLRASSSAASSSASAPAVPNRVKLGSANTRGFPPKIDHWPILVCLATRIGHCLRYRASGRLGGCWACSAGWSRYQRSCWIPALYRWCRAMSLVTRRGAWCRAAMLVTRHIAGDAPFRWYRAAGIAPYHR